MRVSTIRDDKNLSELVDRFYAVGRSTSRRKEVEAALVAVNPGLDLTSGGLAQGEVIVVPDLPSAVPRRTTSGFSNEVARVRLNEVRGLLAELAARAFAADADVVAAAVERLARTDPERIDALGLDSATRDAILEWRALDQLEAERGSEHSVWVERTVVNATAIIEDLLRRLR